LKSFLLRNDLSEPTFYEAEGRALRWGGGWMAAAGRPTFEIKSEFFRKESQKWRIRRIGKGARRARPSGERCKALFIHAKKSPQLKK
jgi:hypothetical protein